VALELWEPYVKFVETILREFPSLQRVYVVSAGRFTLKIVKRLLKYMEEKISGLHLEIGLSIRLYTIRIELMSRVLSQ